MNSPSITYAQRPDGSSAAKRAALANVLRYVLDCHAKKEATRPGSPDDGTKTKGDSANEHRST